MMGYDPEKELLLNNNEAIAAFKIHTAQMQKIVIEINEAIDNIGQNDSEKAESMKDALKKLLEAIIERI